MRKNNKNKNKEEEKAGTTVGEYIDTLYSVFPKEEFLGEPSHHYLFTIPEEQADSLGYLPDSRGHRDDSVKLPAHPSHPSRGTWNGDEFQLTDLGMQSPNYTLFGLNDEGQDPQAVLTYKGGAVIPEITVTPNGNYVENPYDNIIMRQKGEGGTLDTPKKWDDLSFQEKSEMMKIAIRNGVYSLPEIKQKYNEYAEGGKIHIDESKKGTFTAAAAKHGMGVQEFASKVMSNPEDYSPEMRKKAVFAKNAAKWHCYGGNLFGGGGYKPSEAIKRRIAEHEGKAMTGAKDPLSGKYAKNNSFEVEAKGFYNALPKDIRDQVLSNQGLADNLYSYSYNVGAGNFKRRVVPTLQKYYKGQASIEDIENSMWASGDNKLRGLQRRRAQERAGVRSALWDYQMGGLNTAINNPIPVFMQDPSQVYSNPLTTYEAPVVPAAPEQPLVDAAIKDAYTPEKIAEEERKDRAVLLGSVLNNFNQSGEYSPFINAINVLTGRGYGRGGNLFDDGGDIKGNASKQAPWYSELDETVLGEVMQQFRNSAHPGNIEHTSYSTDARGKKGGTAQRTYLLPRFEQEDIFLRDGYIKGKEGDYGLVKKAVNNRNLPVWQTKPDAISRETLVPIGNAYDWDSYGYIKRDKELVHAGAHPSAFYVDGSTGKLYIKGWDLNDYGGTGGGNSSKYNIFEKAAANILDFVGNPVVVTTGFQEVTNPWGGVGEHLNRGGTIQDLFEYDDEGYPIASPVGKLLDNVMGKRGLHRENIDGKWLYALPEVTVTGKKKALGGHLFDGNSEPVNALYKPEENVVHRVTRVNSDLVGMDPDTGKFYDNTTGNYIGDHVALEDIVVTPQNGTIDDMGNIYQTVGGVTHMTTSDGKHIILGEEPVSNVDPVGEFFVEGTALSPLFKPVERVVSGVLGAPEIVKSGKEYLGKVFNNASKVLRTKGNKKVSEPPIITAKNAASITPEQWTAAQDAAIARALNITPEEAASLTKEQYEAAIARGVDTKELLKLRLLHNSVKAPNNKVRTSKGKGEPFILNHDTDHEPWNVYDDSYFGGTDEGWYGKGLYLSGAPFGKNAYGKNTMKLLVNVENPVYAKDNFEVGLAKQFFNRGIPKEDALKILESSLEPDELELFLKHKKSITKALDRVYNADGVIVPLDANEALNRPYSPYHEVVVPDGRKVKSADAVTFDDNGVRIPLGERDNFNINDIRYGLLPFGIGFGGLGLMNEE